MDTAQTAARVMADLTELGAADVFGVAASHGTGPMAQIDPDKFVVCGVQGAGTMGGIRAAERALDHLSLEIRGRLDRWDPTREAMAIRPFFSKGGPVANRRTWGARPSAWQALEDKVIIDDLWDLAGVIRAPFRVTPAAGAERAAHALDAGAGTVWAGDAREGFNGGATYTRWVRTRAEAAEATGWFNDHCDRVRVMPSLEGVPCSIHAMLAPGDDHVVVLRPMEMVVLRNAQGFVYCGGAGTWRPSEHHRREMRTAAGNVARHLSREHGYRGAFTLDGVLTDRGFLPTELNPRFGAAMKPYQNAEMPLMLLHFAMIEGESLDWRMADLEDALLDLASDTADTWCGLPMDAPFDGASETLHLAIDPDIRHVDEGHAQVQLLFGTGPGGSTLRMRFSGEHTPVGPPLAPTVARVVNHAREVWNLPIAEVRSAAPPPEP